MPRQSRLSRDALRALSEGQDHVVSYAQLHALGLPSSTLSYRIRPDGPWRRVLPGVCLTQSGAPSVQQKAQAALLYAGPDSLLTGCEALVRHGFRHIPPDMVVHVLVPDGTQKRSVDFVVIERTTRLPTAVKRFGLPCAPVPRAVFDTTRRQHDQRVVTALVAEAIQRKKCSLQDLVTEVRTGQTRGSRLLRLALADVIVGVRSAAESEARTLIRRGSLPEPLWNHDLFLADGTFLACPDGWYPEHGVALEIDSREFHLDPEGWQKTLRRHLLLSSFGILVVHVTPRQVRREPLTVVRHLAGALEGASGPRVPITAAPAGTRPHRSVAST